MPRIWPTGSDKERGASLVEYALLLSLIALVCFSAVAYFGTRTSARFSSSGSAIATAGG